MLARLTRLEQQVAAVRTQVFFETTAAARVAPGVSPMTHVADLSPEAATPEVHATTLEGGTTPEVAHASPGDAEGRAWAAPESGRRAPEAASRTVTSQFTMPSSEMLRFSEMTLAPFKLWIEAAETWQRNWMAATWGGVLLPEPPSMNGGNQTKQEIA
jgi:hypothetical protein